MKNIKKYWLWSMLVFCPIVYSPTGENLRDFQEHFLQYMSIGFICLFLENIWLTLFVLLNILLYIYNGGQVGSMQVLNIFFGCLMFRFSRSWFKKNSFESCYTPIMITLTLTLIFVVLQKFHIDPLTVPQNGAGELQDGPVTQAVGLFGIQMANSIFMAMCVPILASINIFLAPFLLFPIYLCQSSAGMLAALSASGFYIFHLYRKWFKYFVGFLVLGGILFVWHDAKEDPMTMHSRFPMWHSVVKYSLHRPEGYGPDSFRNYNTHKDFKFNADNVFNTIISGSPEHDDNKVILTYYSPSNDSTFINKMNERASKQGLPKDGDGRMTLNMFDDPHNEYLKVLFEYGIVGIILLIGLLNEMTQRFRKATKSRELVTITACLIVFAVSSMSQFPLSIARLAVFVPILGGAFYAATEREEKIA